MEVEGGQDKLSKVQSQVANLKNVMLDNVDKVMQRGERLDRLGESSDELAEEAGRFKSRAKAARKAMWWQKCRLQIMIVSVVLIVVLIIFLVACFANGKNCTEKK